MTRFYKFLLVALAAVSLFSCARESAETVHDDTLVRLVVSADLGEDVKAHLGTPSAGALPVLWDDGDAIAVYDGTAVRRFTIVPGSNQGTTAQFSGEVSASATSLKAAYPYEAATLSGDGFDVNIPAVQNANGNSLATGATMATASAAKGETFHFHNAVALVRMTVADGVSRVVLHTVNGESIAAGNSRSVQLKLPGTAGTWQMAVKPGSYEGIMVFTTGTAGSYVKQSAKTLSITASQSCNLGDLSGSTAACVIADLQDLKAFLAGASSISKAYVVADIDCGSSSLQSADSFAGELDGLGHEIGNLSISNALINVNTGTISNLSLAGNCNAPSDIFAPLVRENKGSISKVRSNVGISLTSSASKTESVLLAGIAAMSSGTITDCSNSAGISFKSTSGVAGVGVAGIVGYSTGAIENCTNTGDLNLECAYVSNVSTIGSITKACPSMGGILAFGQEGSSIKGCINRGHITHVASGIGSTPSLSFRSQFGGIVGSPAGPVAESHNYGAVDVTAKSSDGSEFSAYNYIVGVAGISGGEFLSANQNTTSISDCTNSGAITVRCDASRSNSTIGGIVAWPGVENESQTVKTSRCSNSGNIVVSGAGKYRIGGIQGGSGHMLDCSNSGSVTNNGTNTASAIGGLCGFHSRNHAISSCSSTGNVSTACNCMVGGLIGNHGNAATSLLSGSKVECKLTTPGDQTNAGMIIGKFSGTSAAVVCGTSDSPVDVSGTISLAGSEILVHKNNYTNYLAGTANAASVHEFHAVCNTEAPAAQLYAEGHVTYSDGSAARGVSVSDGFNVAVTDENGYYRLETCSDSWYIYFSYPSDAVIAKNSNGCPDFYRRYNQDAHTYDFSFEKQAVETEFALFAMADPQAHYAVRGSQKKADTTRFLEESVPAINNEISSMSIPCYGVTLGDIVYSENSRNSNAGMATMRSNFGKVNMPVFQVMGNHDYTFFYSTSALTPDSGSSTTQIKVQRKFEDTFGPVNYSFNRGNVHVICMRDIIWDSTTDASSYHGGFTNDQYNWVKADLANVPSNMSVILCVHIPLVSLSTRENVKNVLNLIKTHPNSTVFSGHTHYKRGVSSTCSSGLYEHVHAAVCGSWWWSRISGDGCPNGYTVYKFSGTSIADEYFKGVNEGMNERSSCQMRIYRGGMTYGGSYAYFNTSAVTANNQILINLFNGDSRWKSVKVYENGTLSGSATLISASNCSFASVSSGSTNSVTSTSSQDWWAIGFHIGVVGRGTTSTSYYTTCFHMYKYTLKNNNSSVKVVATDSYGNEYSCEDVVDSGTSYPYTIVGIR